MECRKYRFTDLPVLDRNIIKGIPWAEEMWNVLEDGLNRAFLYWCQMVLKIGENGDVVKEWVDVFIKTYEETCCDLVSDMKRVQRNVIFNIEALLKEFQQLRNTLQIHMPVLGDPIQKLSLHQEQQVLKKRIEEYKNLIEVTRSELNKLREKQLELCNMLGKEPKSLRDNPFPSSEELEEFQRYIEELETLKFNRLERFLTIKEEIVEIVNTLNVEPSSQFEKNVLSSDDSVFLVTNENMKRLDLLHKDLVEQQRNVKEEIGHLRNKIDDYWNLLDIDFKEREDFRQKSSGNSLNALQALRTEVQRCQNLKKANIKVFIDKLRNELEQLWKKCHCNETTRTQFRFFNSDCYNEDLLELHEVEIAKWKTYYQENKEILTLLEKHERLWNKMVRLEENATGPNRYNNRGGQLLKEEKERNKLAKQIPQTEEMLCDLADKYRQHHGIYFTTYGTTVSDYLTNLHDERENAKKQKLSARKLQREQSLTPTKSASTLFPSTSSQNVRSGKPQSTAKRKLGTAMRDDRKRLKVSNEKKHKTDNTPIPSIKITSVSGHTKRLSVERKRRIDNIRRRSVRKSQSNIDCDETSPRDYEEFQIELSNRNDCRSTIIPSNVAIASTPSRTLRRRTPASTSTATPSALTATPSTLIGTPSASTATQSASTATPSTSTATQSASTTTPSTLTVTLSTLIGTPSASTTTPSTLTVTLSTLIGTPSALIGTPSALTGTPSTLIGTPSTLIGTPSTLIGTPSTLIGTPSTSGVKTPTNP